MPGGSHSHGDGSGGAHSHDSGGGAGGVVAFGAIVAAIGIAIWLIILVVQNISNDAKGEA